MSVESELAKLALNLLLDRPDELYQVLNDFNERLQARNAMIATGEKPPAVDHLMIVQDFINKFGGVIQLAVNEKTGNAKQILERELSSRLQGLPEGARFKLD